jgi:hypothetical protein
MTLYEFNRLKKNDKISKVWRCGMLMLSCYAIDMFFVEVDNTHNRV